MLYVRKKYSNRNRIKFLEVQIADPSILNSILHKTLAIFFPDLLY